MKRLWLAAALLFIVATLCVVSALYQRHQVTMLMNDLDALETTYRADDMENSLRLAHQLATDYIKRTKWISCFMSHESLVSAGQTTVTLAACLEEDNPEEFLLETAKLRQQLETLYLAELPSLQNIL